MYINGEVLSSFDVRCEESTHANTECGRAVAGSWYYRLEISRN